MNEEERNEELKKQQDELAADSTSRVLSTAAKAAATAAGAPEVGAIIGAAEKIPGVKEAERELSKKINDQLPEQAKESLAKNNQAVNLASNIADTALAASTNAPGTNTPNNGTYITPGGATLNNQPQKSGNQKLEDKVPGPKKVNSTDPKALKKEKKVVEREQPKGYDPNLQNQNKKDSKKVPKIDRSRLKNKDAVVREENRNVETEGEENSKVNASSNNENEENEKKKKSLGKKALSIGAKIFIMKHLPLVIGIIALLLLIFIVIIVTIFLNDDVMSNYTQVSNPTCGRVRFNEDVEEYNEQIAELERQILVATNANDTEEIERLQTERENMRIPSHDIDDYVAGVIQAEVGGFDNEEIYKVFSVVVKTYLFRNSSIEDNYCYISNSSNAQNYVEPTNEKIMEVVKANHALVLTKNGEYASTEYDAFCLDHETDKYYIIKQKKQAFPKKWIERLINQFGDPNWLEEECAGGHGRGMSQYGAYYLISVLKYDWKSVLDYYYGSRIELHYVNISDMDEEGNIVSVGVVGSADLPTGAGGFAWPVTGMDASNTCSRGIGVDGHTGMDIRRAKGTPVYASASGVVTGVGKVGTNGLHWSYGNGVKIKTDNGYTTIYAHFDQPPFVSMNQRVEQGQQIGVVGTTGNSTGYHLHFEVHDSAGNKIDPYTLLSGLPVCCSRGRTCPR